MANRLADAQPSVRRPSNCCPRQRPGSHRMRSAVVSPGHQPYLRGWRAPPRQDGVYRISQEGLRRARSDPL